MQQNEVNMIVQCIPYLDRKQREADRVNKYLVIQQNTKKQIDIQKWFPFPWDKENKNTGTKISEEQAQQYRDRAKELEKRIQNMTFTTIDMNDMYKNTQINNNG